MPESRSESFFQLKCPSVSFVRQCQLQSTGAPNRTSNSGERSFQNVYSIAIGSAVPEEFGIDKMTESIHERRGLSNVVKLCPPVSARESSADSSAVHDWFAETPSHRSRCLVQRRRSQAVPEWDNSQSLGIHRSGESATGKQQICHQHAGHRVPPAGMIDEANDQACQAMLSKTVRARRLGRR